MQSVAGAHCPRWGVRTLLKVLAEAARSWHVY